MKLYTLEGPICALESGQGRTTVVCERCKRGHRTQTGTLSAELVCRTRDIWVTSSDAVLITREAADKIRSLELVGATWVTAEVQWRTEIPWSGEPVPQLEQLRSNAPVNASASAVIFEGCDCGAVRQVSFSPLIVRKPSVHIDVAFLVESPGVLLFSEKARVALEGGTVDLEFKEVAFEGEYTPPSSTFQGEDWSDLT